MRALPALINHRSAAMSSHSRRIFTRITSAPYNGVRELSASPGASFWPFCDRSAWETRSKHSCWQRKCCNIHYIHQLNSENVLPIGSDVVRLRPGRQLLMLDWDSFALTWRIEGRKNRCTNISAWRSPCCFNSAVQHQQMSYLRLFHLNSTLAFVIVVSSWQNWTLAAFLSDSYSQ